MILRPLAEALRTTLLTGWKIGWSFLILLFTDCALRAEETPLVSPSGYIEYWPGTLPVILSAPHGGKLHPKDMPDRGFGKLQRDANTVELAQAMREEMRARFGQVPALIICRLARVKCDCNREIKEAAQGNATAEQAWREYHAFIEEAKTALLVKNPRGLYLDIHGHAHEKQRLELGYLLTKEKIQFTDDALNQPEVWQRSSVHALAKESKLPFSQLLRGPESLGGLFEAAGISSVPSPKAVIDKDDLYFDGGFDVLTHGSRDQGKVDAIQIECPSNLRDTAEDRQKLAGAFDEVISKYMQIHYGVSLKP